MNAESKDLYLSRVNRRWLADRMGKVMSKMCFYDDMDDICFRVDLLEVRDLIDRLLKEYHDEWGDKARPEKQERKHGTDC